MWFVIGFTNWDGTVQQKSITEYNLTSLGQWFLPDLLDLTIFA